jgi:hypothetical protein
MKNKILTQRGREGVRRHQKDFKKFGHKNAIKQK